MFLRMSISKISFALLRYVNVLCLQCNQLKSMKLSIIERGVVLNLTDQAIHLILPFWTSSYFNYCSYFEFITLYYCNYFEFITLYSCSYFEFITWYYCSNFEFITLYYCSYFEFKTLYYYSFEFIVLYYCSYFVFMTLY